MPNNMYKIIGRGLQLAKVAVTTITYFRRTLPVPYCPTIHILCRYKQIKFSHRTAKRCHLVYL